MRPIDADALLEHLRKDPLFKFVGMYGIEGVIIAAPTIDNVKHGRWIKLYDKNYKCSCCGAWWTVDRDSTIKDFKHCPNCGAMMEENGDGET